MSDDLIRRSDAIEAIEVVDWYHQNRNKDMVSGANSDEHQAWYKADDVYKALEAVPSADRPQGEWVKHDDERDYCSVCKHIFKTRTLTKQDKWTTYVDDLGYNYCPNCGARMKGADDE